MISNIKKENQNLYESVKMHKEENEQLKYQIKSL